MSFFQGITNPGPGTARGPGCGIPVSRTRIPGGRGGAGRRPALAVALAVSAALPAEPVPGQTVPAAEAQRLFEAGRAVEAVLSLIAAFDRDPRSPEANRALWALARNAPPQAELADAVEAAAPRLGAEGWIATGVLLRRARRPLDALAAFDRVAADPDDPGAAAADIEAGLLLAELRCHELALARFERRPDLPRAMHGAAVVLARTNRTDEATALTEALLGRAPGHGAARLLRAELLDSVGRGDEAVEDLRALSRATGPAGPASFRLARILLRTGEIGEATPLLEEVVAAAPGNGAAWLALGRAHRSAGRRAEARAAFRRALAEDAALNEARLELARLLARDGAREEAARLAADHERRQTLTDTSARLLGEAELRPEDFRRVAAFVNHALTRRDFGLALRAAQRFLIGFPEDPDRHLLLARVFREGGGFRDAVRVLERGRERFAPDLEARRRFETALRALGRR